MDYRRGRRGFCAVGHATKAKRARDLRHRPFDKVTVFTSSIIQIGKYSGVTSRIAWTG